MQAFSSHDIFQTLYQQIMLLDLKPGSTLRENAAVQLIKHPRVRMLDLVAVGNFGDIVAEHDVLLDAIARNDTAAIRAQCSRHLYGGVTRLGEELSTKYADYFVSGTHWPDHAKEMQP